MPETWTKILFVLAVTGAMVIAAAAAAYLGIRWMSERRRLEQQQLRGHQARNIDAVRSSTIVIAVKLGSERHKCLQVGFLRDGSLFVTFPYFKHRTGLLSAATIPGTGTSQSSMNLEQGGKVTSHLVKYSHHPTGLALFSQDGKIRSEIRRQAVELNRQEGHLFTVLINGLSAFERAQGRKDEAQTPKRTVVTFALPATSASIGTLKIVGRWYDVNRLRFAEPTPSAGPFIPTERGLMAAVLANPAAIFSTQTGTVVAILQSGVRAVPSEDRFLTTTVFGQPVDRVNLFAWLDAYDRDMAP